MTSNTQPISQETIFDTKFTEFLQNGWRNFTTESQIISKIGNETFIQLSVSLDKFQTPLDIFMTIYTEDFFEMLKEKINYNLSILKSTKDGTNVKYFSPNLTRNEIKKFIGYIIYLETSYSKIKNNMLENLQDLFKNLDFLGISKPFGINRFNAIRCAIAKFKPLDLCWLENYLNEKFSKLFIPDKDCQIAFDELLSGYQPDKETKEKHLKKNDPIPVVYIPRKDPPNGFIHYGACAELKKSKLPVLIWVNTRISPPYLSPIENLQKFLTEYSWKNCPFIFTDAIFFSEDLYKTKINNEKVQIIASVPNTHLSFVWNVLDFNLGLKDYRVAERMNDHYIVSSRYTPPKDEEKDGKKHHIFTNAFSITNLYNIENEIVESERTPEDTEESLTRKTNEQLKEILRSLGAPLSGKKKVLVERILMLKAPITSAKVNMKNQLLEYRRSDSAKINNLYQECFNFMDIFNKKYKQADFTYHINDWHEKMFYSIFKLGTVNSFMVIRENLKMRQRDFREKLAISLISLSKE